MALRHKKINDKYMQTDLYYQIFAIEHKKDNKLLVYINGYSDDEDKVKLDEQAYTFIRNKDEVVSYELAYNLLKTKEEFKDAIDC